MNLDDKFTPELVNRTINELSSLNKIFIIKFSAEWCRPCQAIKSFVDERVNDLHENTLFVDLDIDKTLDLYLFLKNKRMVKGIPSILAWYPKTERDMNLWYIPDDSVSGGDTINIAKFFDRCNIHTKYK